MNWTKYTLYIGADNETGILDMTAIVRLVSCSRLEGATIVPTLGYWEGKTESSCMVVIYASDEKRAIVELLASTLAQSLHQESVLLEVQPCDIAFIEAPKKERPAPTKEELDEYTHPTY